MKVKTKVVFWMILLTVSGFVLGGAVTYLFIPSPGPGFSRPPWSPRETMRRENERTPPPPGSEEDPEDVKRRTRFVKMWKDKLDLTQEQAEQFNVIFKAGHQKMEAALKAAGERYGEIRKETDEKILDVLNEDQAERYRQITTEYRNRKAHKDRNRSDGRRNSDD